MSSKPPNSGTKTGVKPGTASSAKAAPKKLPGKVAPVELDSDGISTEGLSLDLGNKNPTSNTTGKTSTKTLAAIRNRDKTGTVKLKKKSLEEATRDLLGSAENPEEEEFEVVHQEVRDPLMDDPIFTNKGNKYPQIHGNYFLLDHLVDGGMAKICRARYLGEGDQVDKMVVIKMVQEKFSMDPDFTAMFIDEIKVSFGLQHPNISTTYDYGKIGKNLFVSMEYIHGKDLNKIIQTYNKKKKKMPVPMAIWITSKMCEGLFYAHNFSNKLTGEKYNIVHRDISPHNIMISYEGYIKVIDFGIAKASTNQQQEEQGTIKGKINYFAPEYLEGKPIDHRYDQFAVALSFWEMLTGQRTFNGDNQINTLKMILACVPESTTKFNKEVPKELDNIIMKALSRDPKNRFNDLMALNKDLLKILYANYPDFHETDIAEMMREFFAEDLQADETNFREWGKISITEIVGKIKRFKELMSEQKTKVDEGPQRKTEIVFDFETEQQSVLNKSDMDSIGSGEATGQVRKRAQGGVDSFQQQLMKELQVAKPTGKKVGATQTRTNVAIKRPPQKGGKRKVEKKKSSFMGWLFVAATLGGLYLYKDQVEQVAKQFLVSIKPEMAQNFQNEDNTPLAPKPELDSSKVMKKADKLLEKLQKQNQRQPSQEN